MLDIRGLLKNAINEGASDVHICVGTNPHIRVHGKLIKTSYPVMNASNTLEVLLFMLDAKQRENFETEGQIDFATTMDDLGRFRVNAYKQKGNITLSIRIVDSLIPDCDFLQIPEPVIEAVETFNGLVIVCGVSGAGKSTTIASLINHINEKFCKNIITLENPIEYVFEHKKSIINQREIGLDAKDYVSGINGALREDPDVLFLNSFNDEEIIAKSMDFAMMNKLVISSMNVCGSVACIKKLATCYNPDKRRTLLSNLSDSLNAIVSRKLCTSTDGKVVPSYEVCVVNKEMRASIREGRLSDLVSQIQKDENCILFDDYLSQLNSAGLIDENTALINSIYK